MSFLAKFAASKYVGDKLEENFGPENPKYDILVTDDGRRKKVKKPLPPGLSAHDARVLRALRRRAWRYEWWVDCHCCCCGPHLQFGTATLWGLLPVVGDAVALLCALALVRAARRVERGLPGHLVAAMLLWAALDFALKLVPLVGDVLAAVVKPNTRNLARVEAFLRSRGEGNLRAAAVGRGIMPGPDAAQPLLVAAQPAAQRGMSAGGGAGPAGPSYGTVRAVGGAAAAAAVAPPPGEPVGGRTDSRHLLPFWKRNAESDSEEEVEGPR